MHFGLYSWLKKPVCQFYNQVRDSKLEFVTSNLYLSKTTAQNMLKNYNAMMVTYDQGEG